MPSFVSLNLNKDFLRLYHKGKSCAKPTLVVSVQRNRARRVIRAALQNTLCAHDLAGWDLVFVARTKTTRVKEPVVRAAMEDALQTLGVIA